MGKKIFISYKYSDAQVLNLEGRYYTTVRNYVDEIQNLLSEEDHINKGEDDGEDLSNFKDSTIASKLRNKIYDSSVTIVVISKGMKDPYKMESEQWIPWEVSYSLQNPTRAGRTSQTNAMLAVVLPDENGRYDYFLTDNEECGCTDYNRSVLFKILGKNMFNEKKPAIRDCDGYKVYQGYFSYIHCVKWKEFVKDINHYITVADVINEHEDSYTISTSVN
ncbi:TIR domain-containing protein [Ancylomarina sp. DW003]|nr:TIR domain-containing protein [Ancylomarina sp. DW003]MDE5420986.1 TIR domain-containing protein [Ancylomarina sp. DW003]